MRRGGIIISFWYLPVAVVFVGLRGGCAEEWPPFHMPSSENNMLFPNPTVLTHQNSGMLALPPEITPHHVTIEAAPHKIISSNGIRSQDSKNNNIINSTANIGRTRGGGSSNSSSHKKGGKVIRRVVGGQQSRRFLVDQKSDGTSPPPVSAAAGAAPKRDDIVPTSVGVSSGDGNDGLPFQSGVVAKQTGDDNNVINTKILERNSYADNMDSSSVVSLGVGGSSSSSSVHEILDKLLMNVTRESVPAITAPESNYSNNSGSSIPSGPPHGSTMMMIFGVRVGANMNWLAWLAVLHIIFIAFWVVFEIHRKRARAPHHQHNNRSSKKTNRLSSSSPSPPASTLCSSPICDRDEAVDERNLSYEQYEHPAQDSQQPAASSSSSSRVCSTHHIFYLVFLVTSNVVLWPAA